MKSFDSAEDAINAAPAWHAELHGLREIVLTLGLEETIKWGHPVYVHNGKNVLGLGGFKSYFGLWFFQGALLKDTRKLLINAQEGKTKALRQMRFQSFDEVRPSVILSYIREAMKLADTGQVIKPDRDRPVEIPPELTEALRKNPRAAKQFEAMSKSCRREYSEYISSAKQPETKQRRLAKILPMIESGGGMNDKYK
jgi:uncharacterized protein YdeI (YjbR/CyaY-like superfamily)